MALHVIKDSASWFDGLVTGGVGGDAGRGSEADRWFGDFRYGAVKILLKGVWVITALIWSTILGAVFLCEEGIGALGRRDQKKDGAVFVPVKANHSS